MGERYLMALVEGNAVRPVIYYGKPMVWYSKSAAHFDATRYNRHQGKLLTINSVVHVTKLKIGTGV